MSSRRDSAWLLDFSGRVLDLATEAEQHFGAPSNGAYATDVEMLLHMAHKAAYRAGQEAKLGDLLVRDPAPAPPPPEDF